MANWYSSYTFPFTKSTFPSYVSNNFNSLGIEDNNNMTKTSLGTVSIGGTTYNKYKLTSGVMALSNGAVAFFKTNDGCLYTNRNNYKVKKPTAQTGTSTTSANPSFPSQPDYWIKITSGNNTRYVGIYNEIDGYIGAVTWSNKTSLAQSEFEPYEPVHTVLGTLSATGTPWTRSYNSNTIGSATTGTAETVSTNFSSSYSSPGTRTATAYFSDSSLDNRSISWSITISAWENDYYAITENATSYSVYAGKEVGSDFLGHFSFVHIQSNDYHTQSTVVQSSLDKSGLSVTKYSENSYVSFTYTYNGNSANFSDANKTVINLASGSTKFNLITYKSSYQQGETLVISDIDITQSGSLLYSDGTSISLADVDFISSPSVTCSLGNENSYYLDETILGFTMTYNMPTQYFGSLSFQFNCSVSGQTEDYITMIVLKGAKTEFHAGETLSLGSNAYIECYNANGVLKETVTANNFSGNITSYPDGYGQPIGAAYMVDGAITLTGTFRTLRQWSWTIYVTWDESLGINTYNVQKTYYVDSAEDFELDTTGLTAHTKTHHNNSIGTSITLDSINVSDCVITYAEFELEHGNRVVPITVSYTNSYGQTTSKSYDVNVILIEPESLIISGAGDSTHYYDNDVEKFHYPTGLTFKVRYTDNTEVTLNDLTGLEFYRNAELSVQLTVGVSIIRSSEGSRIYVYDPDTGVSGYYIISFDEDTISNVYLNNSVTFVLGNRLNAFRDLFQIKALHASGVISDVSDYAFKDTGYILSDTEVVDGNTVAKRVIVVVDETEYTLDSNNITFTKPDIDEVALELNGFQTSYNNQSDGIDARGVVAKVSYENAEYVQTCTFDSDSVQDTEHFQISSSSADMANFDYDGSDNLNIDMGNDSEVEVTLTFTCKSIFKNETATATQAIHVLDILDVTGISILSVYNDYHVGDKFLNENDDTMIQIFYKDTNQVQKKFITKLNGGFAAINVLPTKNSEFNKVGLRTIKVTSSSNYNVAAEYTITVAAKYVYDNTVSHDLVAIKQGSYTCPNGVTILDHYILIDRNDENGLPNTQLLSTGARVLATGKTIQDVNVYGYLEDIMDESKNARVILFEDYIPPIDGSNNIEVTYPCYVPGYADKINKCHFGILFGNNNAKNRLFVSGNPDEPNCDWHSGMIDENNIEDESMLNGNFGYFEDTSWCYYGETDNKVVGYDIVSNDKLLVLKDHSDKETTIYFRTPVLVTAIDGAGTQMSGIDGETLYQEEFSLVKGNNSVAGISPKSIINFNGDSLFLSNDNNMVGLDLTGIIGDNQRYANSRSYFIDEDLKDRDLSKAWLWSDNKYLFLCLKDKTYVTHFEAKGEKQYEWWAIDVKDIQVVLKVGKTFYFGNSQGEFFKFNDIYDDVKKVFVGAGGGILASEGENDNTIIVTQAVINQLDENGKYKFSIIPSGREDTSYMYYSIGNISNVKSGNLDFYVNLTHNALELLCLRDGNPDYEQQKRFTAFIREGRNVYLNHIQSESTIGCAVGSELATYYKKYYLKRYVPDSLHEGGDLYKLYDAETNTEVTMSELYRAVLCYRLDEEYDVVDIDKANYSFKLELEGEELDLVRYADQLYSRAFQAEIKSYEPVLAFYITKPYTLGDLNYFKTIWQYTLTNDTNIPSELELTYASNKIPYESTKTLAKISVDKFSFNLNDMDFRKIDFDKNITPRTYTNSRILPRQKFICFGFRNYNNTNSVLSSMSIIYSIPHASYSGD